MWFPAARSLADLQIFCWKSSTSCRLLEYKQTFFGVVVLVFVRFFQPVCATLALFRFVSASFTLTTIAVGNTGEDFATVLSPWSIWALKGSVDRSRHERHFCSLLPYFLLSWLQIFQLCLSFWTSSFDLVLFLKILQEKEKYPNNHPKRLSS